MKKMLAIVAMLGVLGLAAPVVAQDKAARAGGEQRLPPRRPPQPPRPRPRPPRPRRRRTRATWRGC